MQAEGCGRIVNLCFSLFLVCTQGYLKACEKQRLSLTSQVLCVYSWTLAELSGASLKARCQADGTGWNDIAMNHVFFSCLVQTWSFQHFSICCSPHCDLLQGFGNYEPPPEDWARWECLPTIYEHLWARLQTGVAGHFLFESFAK